MWLLENLNSKKGSQPRTSQSPMPLLEHKVDELAVLLNKQSGIEDSDPLPDVSRRLTEQSRQSIVSLKEWEYWNSTGCHTKSDPV
jgi:hypothetical protein